MMETMTWAAMDVHARSTQAAAVDAAAERLSRFSAAKNTARVISYDPVPW